MFSQEKISRLVVGVGDVLHPPSVKLGRHCSAGKGGAGCEKGGRSSKVKVGGEGREGKEEGRNLSLVPGGTGDAEVRHGVPSHLSLQWFPSCPPSWPSYRHPDPLAASLIQVRGRGRWRGWGGIVEGSCGGKMRGGREGGILF